MARATFLQDPIGWSQYHLTPSKKIDGYVTQDQAKELMSGGSVSPAPAPVATPAAVQTEALPPLAAPASVATAAPAQPVAAPSAPVKSVSMTPAQAMRDLHQKYDSAKGSEHETVTIDGRSVQVDFLQDGRTQFFGNTASGAHYMAEYDAKGRVVGIVGNLAEVRAIVAKALAELASDDTTDVAVRSPHVAKKAHVDANPAAATAAVKKADVPSKTSVASTTGVSVAPKAQQSAIAITPNTAMGLVPGYKGAPAIKFDPAFGMGALHVDHAVGGSKPLTLNNSTSFGRPTIDSALDCLAKKECEIVTMAQGAERDAETARLKKSFDALVKMVASRPVAKKIAGAGALNHSI
jgi:hypothetical protein